MGGPNLRTSLHEISAVLCVSAVKLNGKHINRGDTEDRIDAPSSN